jgi:hypothetical protein
MMAIVGKKNIYWHMWWCRSRVSVCPVRTESTHTVRDTITKPRFSFRHLSFLTKHLHAVNIIFPFYKMHVLRSSAVGAWPVREREKNKMFHALLLDPSWVKGEPRGMAHCQAHACVWLWASFLLSSSFTLLYCPTPTCHFSGTTTAGPHHHSVVHRRSLL